jgi:hypothetical protein
MSGYEREGNEELAFGYGILLRYVVLDDVHPIMFAIFH